MAKQSRRVPTTPVSSNTPRQVRGSYVPPTSKLPPPPPPKPNAKKPS